MSPISSTSCKILAISSELSHAHHLVHRIISFAANETATDVDPTPTSGSGGSTIPWKISNKYYTADVHFETITIDQYLPRRNEFDGVPAVLLVWNRGQPYREHVEKLSGAANTLDPEIKLAIQFSTDKSNSVVAATTSSDDDQETDEFVSSHGFEFINGDNESRARVLDSDDDSIATPGLSRVIDALSTIMWPSMVQSSSSSSGSASNRKSKAMELLDWAREEECDDGFRALIQTPSIDEAESDISHPSSSTDPPPSSEAKPKTSRMQKEMDEFQRWLEEDESQRVNEDPWARRDEFGSALVTPTAETFVGSGTGFGDGDRGFEDDFTDFVGAPMDHEPRRPETKKPSSAYMSLDSGFDILEEDDTDLPSKDEIQATTRRLFGSSPSHPPPSTSESKQLLPTTDFSDLGVSPAPSSVTLGDEDEFEFSQFDLSRVFSALQVMKEEVSEITDDVGRRRAAARVALGLVYGLQRDEDADVQ